MVGLFSYAPIMLGFNIFQNRTGFSDETPRGKTIGSCLRGVDFTFTVDAGCDIFRQFPVRNTHAYGQYSTGFSPQFNLCCFNTYWPSYSDKDQEKIDKRKALTSKDIRAFSLI